MPVSIDADLKSLVGRRIRAEGIARPYGKGFPVIFGTGDQHMLLRMADWPASVTDKTKVIVIGVVSRVEVGTPPPYVQTYTSDVYVIDDVTWKLR